MDLRRPARIAAALTAVAVAGCGGGSSNDAKDEGIHFRGKGVAIDLPGGWVRERGPGTIFMARGPSGVPRVPVHLGIFHFPRLHDWSAAREAYHWVHQVQEAGKTRGRPSEIVGGRRTTVPGAEDAYAVGLDYTLRAQGRRVRIRERNVDFLVGDEHWRLTVGGPRRAVTSDALKGIVHTLRVIRGGEGGTQA